LTGLVSDRQLNRWTLARQMLLERAALDAETAIGRLAGMQAQYSPSPYIGLWSRLDGFRREELESAVLGDRVYKATLMRGTLHLVPATDFDLYRGATRNPYHFVNLKRLADSGADLAAIRTQILEAVREGPLNRVEIARLTKHHIPPEMPDWSGWSAVAVAGDLFNLPEDARFGYFGPSRYRVAPPNDIDVEVARRHLLRAYLAAFGPASRADFAQWSGRTVAAFAAAFRQEDIIEFRHEDGRILLDLAAAPRPDPEVVPPVRFLPKWDNLLLAYARRERVLPEPYRKTVIRKNGDVLATFLVDGLVAGTWEAKLRGPAVLTLTPLGRLGHGARRAVADEARQLLAWLRPESTRREVAWLTA
jgi:uncharacterized protein YcaQ